ncbi:MAG: ABC transporter ATP-binding protein [Oscillospiraceae bacterium]
MKQLFTNFKGYRVQLVLGPIFKLSEAIMELFVPMIMANIIDVGILQQDIPYIIKNGILLLVIGALGFSFALVCQYFASLVAQGFGKSLRTKLFHHIFKLSQQDTEQIGSSTLITRLTNDVNQMQTGVNMFIRLAIRAPYLAIGSVVMALKINFKIGAIFLISTPLILLLLYFITHICMPYYTKLQLKQDNISKLSGENLTGARVIRAFGREGREIDDFKNEGERLCKTTIKVGKLSALLNPLTAVITNIAIVAIVYFGAEFVNIGAISSGKIIALVNYMTQTLLALIVLSNVLPVFTKALASAKRVSEIMDMRSSMQYNKCDFDKKETDEILHFDNVSFAYASGDEAISNITFSLNKGETLGIIGGTGCGKSTLMRVIMRMYDAQNGKVILDGKNIKEYTLKELHQYFAYVPQTAIMFSGTVRDNINMGALNATDEEIWQALEIAQGKEFVKKMDKGLDTVINEDGKNLSGGQKQRIAIARALLLKRNIIMLDDATSALDYATDAALRKAMNIYLKDNSVIIVSQRAASLKNADKILVLNDGELAGIGTHKVLFDNCDIYKEICLSQGIGKEAKCEL